MRRFARTMRRAIPKTHWNLKRFAKAHDFPFPYLHDQTQTVARAYGAVCTPDFFGYNADRRLKYRGRSTKAAQLRLARRRPESLSRPCVRLRPRHGDGSPKASLAARSNGKPNKAEPLLPCPEQATTYAWKTSRKHMHCNPSARTLKSPLRKPHATSLVKFDH